MALSDQASRLLRRNFDDPILAQELYAMFVADTGDTTGALSVSLSRLNGAVNFTAQGVDTLGIPAVDLDGATSVEIVRDTSAARTEVAGAGALQETTRPFAHRSVLLGKVVSFESGPGTYTVDLYPHGTDGTALRVIGVIPLVNPSAPGGTIPTNTWLDVFRVLEAQAVTKEFFDPTGLAISKTTTVETVVEKHYVINPEVVITGDLALPGHVTLSGTNRLFLRDTGVSVSSDADGFLRLEADGTIRLAIGGAEQITIGNNTAGFFGKAAIAPSAMSAPANWGSTFADLAEATAAANSLSSSIGTLRTRLRNFGFIS